MARAREDLRAGGHTTEVEVESRPTRDRSSAGPSRGRCSFWNKMIAGGGRPRTEFANCTRFKRSGGWRPTPGDALPDGGLAAVCPCTCWAGRAGGRPNFHNWPDNGKWEMGVGIHRRSPGPGRSVALGFRRCDRATLLRNALLEGSAPRQGHRESAAFSLKGGLGGDASASNSNLMVQRGQSGLWDLAGRALAR